MLKIIITVTTLLLSMVSLAQTEEKNLQADIRGRDCHGGSGLCSITTTDLNKTTTHNINIKYQSQNIVLLEFDLSQLSIEDQKIHFGLEFPKNTKLEKFYFKQEEDFIFDGSILNTFGIDPKYNLLSKGHYPTQILGNLIRVTLTLSQQ